MVLIGPQSGGKSTIAKLVGLVNDIAYTNAGIMFNRLSKERLYSLFLDGLIKYNIHWDLKDTLIDISTPTFHLVYQNQQLSYGPNDKLNKANENFYSFQEELYDLGMHFMDDYKSIENYDKFLTYPDYGFSIIGLELMQILQEISHFTGRLLLRVRPYRAQLETSNTYSETEKIHFKSLDFYSKLEPYLDDKSKEVNVALPEVISFIKSAISFFRTFLPNTKVVYIPAERMFTPLLLGTSFNLQKLEILLPKCVIDFVASFEVSRKALTKYKIKELGVTYNYIGGKDIIELDNNNLIALTEGSSGMQTMIPMAMVTEYYSNKKGKEEGTSSTFIVEEPELNLYPTTQKQLVDFLAERCIDERNSLLVTTHSPYILSAFANLIKANEVAKQSDEKKAKIKKIVPESLWLEYNETSAYFIDKGVSETIMDEQFKTIDFSKIDKASDLIGDEFDKLLSIEIEAE